MRQFIDKVLYEATFEVDRKQVEKAKEIIHRVQQDINSFKGFNSNSEGILLTQQKCFYLKYEDIGLVIVLFDHDSNFEVAIQAKQEGAGGKFFNMLDPQRIDIYECVIDFDIKTGKINELMFDETVLLHELIHYLDYQRLKNKKHNPVPLTSNNQSEENYYNSPLEFNAYFNHTITPTLDEMLKNDKIIFAIKKRGWNIFKEYILSLYFVEKYYSKLNDKYKKKFLKRLAEYYQKITNKVKDTTNG